MRLEFFYRAIDLLIKEEFYKVMAKTESTKLSSKLKAIEVIVKELQKLEEQDRQGVISFALDQLGMKSIQGSTVPLGGAGQSATPGNSSTGINNSMADFVKNKKPQNEYQRVAVIAYYLEHKDRKKEFKNIEMSKANTENARQPKISNITDVVSKARDRYKFLTKGMGKATHQLSTHGADIVEALPDEAKVKTLIAEGKSRKTQKKKGAKK